jgi:hypothetical protein
VSVVVFLGPTLEVAAAREALDATYLPPVAQGDVYRAALGKPWAIAIIDGYFERLPSVWHKEILWAMSQGIHVFGASSMGALRALELAPFGMVGIGRIYDGFAAGVLTDDDEVTVVHGEAETGYRNLSTAMVDIRATLSAAREQGVVTESVHEQLVELAKSCHYADRSYPGLLQRAARAGFDTLVVDRLRAWLERGRVQQKRLDALDLLQQISSRLQSSTAPLRVDYAFEHTDAWEQVTRRWSQASNGALDPAGDDLDELLDELYLHPTLRRDTLREALLSALALDAANRHGLRVDESGLERAVESFRRERRLDDRKAIDAWLAEQALDPSSLGELLQRHAMVGLVSVGYESSARRLILDQLRLSGHYAVLRARARKKRQTLEQRGVTSPSLRDTGLTEAELLDWYAGQPTSLTGASVAATAEQSDRANLVQALLREYIYQKGS